MPVTDTILFALALEQMEGVGRVTAGRLLGHFPTHADLLRYPREQVLARIKGAPRAQALVGQLFDETAMGARLAAAAEAAERLRQKRIEVLTPHDPRWPAGLDDLDRSDRPFRLFAYGHADVLARPTVAFFGRAPLTPAAFEQAQALARHLLPHGVVPVTGAAPGFDVVFHKLAGLGEPARPSVLVCPAGLGRVVPPLRPVATLAVRSGGLMLSPFEMLHGPFDHDDDERARVQAALATACAFFDPQPGTPEAKALAWALAHERAVFGYSTDPPLPERVHRLDGEVDFDWVRAALGQAAG